MRSKHARGCHGQVPPQAAERLVVDSGRVLFVQVAEIDWIDAANYYACLHVGAHTHILRRSLSVLAQELDAATFCRIHRLDHRQPSPGPWPGALTDDGEYCVLLKSGERLRASRRFRRSLQERLGLGVD